MSPSLFLSAVGVDIAKASFDAALPPSADGKYKHKKFDTAPEGFALFAAWLASFGSDAPHVWMESTGPYSLPLADYLDRARLPCSAFCDPPKSPPSPRAN